MEKAFPALRTIKYICHTAATYCVTTVIKDSWSIYFHIIYLKAYNAFKRFYYFDVIFGFHYLTYLKVIKFFIFYNFTAVVLLACLTFIFQKTFLTNCVTTIYY